jgi:hypothetical protein
LEIIAEYIQLWDILYVFQLQPEVGATDGYYSTKSEYDNLFMGATQFKLCERI